MEKSFGILIMSKVRDITAIKKFCKFVNNYDGELRITLDGSVYEKDKLVYKYEPTQEIL